MPGLVPGAARGRGRGREVLSVVRSVDLILFMIDPDHLDFRALLTELEGSGVRVNGRPPKIVLTRGDRGGLTVSSTVKLTHLGGGLAVGICREFGVHNGGLVLREDATAEQLIDVLAGNRVYPRAILAVNKAELLSPEDRARITAQVKPFQPLFISARSGAFIPELTTAIGETLQFIRIYVKPPGREADRTEPVILRKGDLDRRSAASTPDGARPDLQGRDGLGPERPVPWADRRTRPRPGRRGRDHRRDPTRRDADRSPGGVTGTR